MVQQGKVAGAELLPLEGFEWAHGRTQVVGAMPARHPADLPEAAFQPLGQGLKALGKAQTDRLDIRIGQHQVEEHVREGHAAQRDPQIAHVREVRLSHLPRRVLLREHHLALRAVQRPPGGDVSLQRAHLPRAVASRVLGL